MSHSQMVSAGEDMVLEQRGFPKEPGEVEEVDEVEEEDEVQLRQKRFQYLRPCVPLYQAAFQGNWQDAKALLDVYPDMVRDPITEVRDTALHIAAAANHPNFVKELLKLMKKEDLETKNIFGQTALYLAAASGNVITAEEMVKKYDNREVITAEEMMEKNKKLTLIGIKSGEMNFTPLYIAASLGHGAMVSFLFSKTPFEDLSAEDRIELLVATISNDLFDIALRIMKKDGRLATAKDRNGKTALYELAGKPFAIGSKSQLSVSKRCLNSWCKRIYNKAPSQTLARQLVESLWREVRLLQGKQFSDHVETFLFEAAKMGNAEFVNYSYSLLS